MRFRHLKLLAMLALVFALFFFGLGSYPLFDLDEPRYAEAAGVLREDRQSARADGAGRAQERDALRSLPLFPTLGRHAPSVQWRMKK